MQPCHGQATHPLDLGLAQLCARPDIVVRSFGAATLICGEAIDVLRGVPAGSMGALLCDPPYSSGGLHAGDRTASTVSKYVQGEDRHRYRDFGGDNRDQRSYLAWSAVWLDLARRAVRPSGLCGVFSDWRQLPITTDAVQAGGWIWRGIVPWDKTERVRPQLGRYRNQAEYLVWGSSGKRPIAGRVAPGVVRATVPGNKVHLAQKPVELMCELLGIMDGPVLDPFAGSGTVGVACLELGLPYLGIEADPHFFEVACVRLAQGAADGVAA